MTVPRVIVLGDACIDQYVFGHCVKLNPESGAPLLTMQSSEKKFGMALNVKDNLKAFGLEVDSITPKEKSIKTRYIDKRTGQQLLRLDQDVKSDPLVIENVEGLNQYAAVVISDYDKGFISETLLQLIDKVVKTYVFVDTKKTNLSQYENLIFKINQLELRKLDSPPKNLIVTLGKQGAWYNQKTYSISDKPVVDVCGAGDMFLSALVYGIVTGKNIDESIHLANRAASISVMHQGVYVLSDDDVKQLTNKTPLPL